MSIYMNNNIFVVSDTWFNRPIGDKSDMDVVDYNNEIIENWNKTVNKTDDVYVLGGFGISDLYAIAIKLNGKIHFLNNYYTDDEVLFIDNLKVCVSNSIDKKLTNKLIFEDKQILSLNDDDVILSYFPLSDWYGKSTGTLCFHGMNFDSNFKEGNVCCCLAKNNFKPLNINDVKSKLSIFSNVIS